MKVIGLVGDIGSGKDTVANYLVEEYGFVKIVISAPLKDCVASLFGWNREDLNGESEQSRRWREQIDEYWSARLNIAEFTPRYALQYVGTELIRKHFCEDFFCIKLEQRILDLINNNNQSTNGETKINGIVVSDCRFRNELHLIKEIFNGQIFCLIRNNVDTIIKNYEHAENDWKKYKKIDETILNFSKQKRKLFAEIDYHMNKIFLN